MKQNSESGQVLIAVIILLAIIVIGMYIVGHSMGVDYNPHIGPTCYDYLNVVRLSAIARQ